MRPFAFSPGLPFEKVPQRNISCDSKKCGQSLVKPKEEGQIGATVIVRGNLRSCKKSRWLAKDFSGGSRFDS